MRREGPSAPLPSKFAAVDGWGYRVFTANESLNRASCVPQDPKE